MKTIVKIAAPGIALSIVREQEGLHVFISGEASAVSFPLTDEKAREVAEAFMSMRGLVYSAVR